MKLAATGTRRCGQLKTRIKRALVAAENGADDADEQIRVAAKRIDKAASAGVIHPNQAARRKSRLMRHANSSGESPASS